MLQSCVVEQNKFHFANMRGLFERTGRAGYGDLRGLFEGITIYSSRDRREGDGLEL